MYHATLYAPEALAVLREVVWRLLDPTPIGYVELSDLYERRYPTWEVPRGIKVVLDDLEGFPDYEWVHVRTGALKQRRGLTDALYAMRSAELRGKEREYHLHLLGAMERLASKELDPDLQLLGVECCDYLATCFGRIEVPQSVRRDKVMELRLGLSAYLGADPFGVITGGELEWCPR